LVWIPRFVSDEGLFSHSYNEKIMQGLEPYFPDEERDFAVINKAF
jgi:hypothetical protein